MPLLSPFAPPNRSLRQVIPFGAIVLVTFFGMYADGLAAIAALPEGGRPERTLSNAFANRWGVGVVRLQRQQVEGQG